MPFDQQRYIEEFKDKNYDKVRLRIEKKDHERLKEIAIKQNVSMNKLIIRAIEKYYSIIISKD